LNADETTEGAETLTLSVAGETADVTVNDTSTTPVQPESDFSLTAASTSVDEGDSVVFTLTDANQVANGETFSYEISGVSSDDVDGSRTGSVTVDSNGEAKITVNAVADEITEGAETLTLSVAGETADVTVNDTSTTPTDLTLTTDSDSVEGTDADETVTGTFANDGVGNDLGNIQLSDSIDLGSGDDTAEIRLTQDMDNTLAPEF
jgi:ribosomal protein L25 (general stress protein Ctc)